MSETTSGAIIQRAQRVASNERDKEPKTKILAKSIQKHQLTEDKMRDKRAALSSGGDGILFVKPDQENGQPRIVVDVKQYNIVSSR